MGSGWYIFFCTHFKFQLCALHQFAMLHEWGTKWLPVQQQLRHIYVCGAVLRSGNMDGFSIGKMQGGLPKQRTAHCIFAADGRQRIKAQGREYVPSRHLPIVFVATIAVGTWCIKARHDGSHQALCLPRLAKSVEVWHVVHGFVQVGVLSHVGILHLPDEVDDAALIIRNVVTLGLREHRVELFQKLGLSAHQLLQANNIVRNKPSVLPAVAFCKMFAPAIWVERR